MVFFRPNCLAKIFLRLYLVSSRKSFLYYIWILLYNRRVFCLKEKKKIFHFLNDSDQNFSKKTLGNCAGNQLDFTQPWPTRIHDIYIYIYYSMNLGKIKIKPMNGIYCPLFYFYYTFICFAPYDGLVGI